MIATEGTRWREALKLEQNESVASILLKLEQLGAREVAIVAPPELKAFRNPVSMRLLQRKAQDLGIALTIISSHPFTRQLCAETGFTHYADLDAFRRDDIRRKFHDRPKATARRPFGSRLSIAGGLALLALITIVGSVVLPAATVTVVPEATTLALDVPVTADSSASTIDAAARRIPAKFVTSGEISGQAIVNATGQRDVPDQDAHGVVTFTNQTAQAVTVPKSTIVLAGPIAFATLQDTQVAPTVNAGGVTITGTGSTTVAAVLPGESGNVKVGAITAIDGPLASKLTVKNDAAFTGGSNKKQGFLSADDQAKAKQALLAQLRQQALDRIHGQIARNESFVQSPDSAGDGAVEELTYELSPEQVTSSTTLHLKVMVRGLTFQGDDINQVVQQAMQDAAAKEGSGARLLDEPLTIQPPVVVGNDGTAVRLQVHATGRMAPPLDRGALQDRVQGLDAATAKAALERTPGIRQASVKLWPAWVRKVPWLAWRVSVAIASPAS
jgi:hypothetical protein